LISPAHFQLIAAQLLQDGFRAAGDYLIAQRFESGHDLGRVQESDAFPAKSSDYVGGRFRRDQQDNPSNARVSEYSRLSDGWELRL